MALLTSHIHGPSGNPANAQGGIIQVRQNIYKTDQSFTTEYSFFDTGLTCDITPTSSGNHVLIFAQLTFQPNSAAMTAFRVLRGSTVLDVGVSGGGQQALVAGTQDGSRGAYPSIQLLDTGIATTSSTTYKVQCYTTQATRINGRDSDYRGCSIMTLMELSA